MSNTDIMKETEDDVLSSAAAGVMTTSWQDAMAGGQQGISNSDRGIPKEQQKQTSPNNSPKTKIVRNVSFAFDNVDTDADNSKPPASKNMQHNAGHAAENFHGEWFVPLTLTLTCWCMNDRIPLSFR